ncbi:MAG: hypothetical protein ABEJ79_09135 [Halolamina sp.]
MTVNVETEGGVLRFVDTIEHRQCRFSAPEPITVSETDAEEFVFPVDRAVAVDATSLTLDALVSGFVRDGDGRHVATVDHDDRHEFPAATYLVELGAAMKLYVRAEGRLVVDTDGPTTTVAAPDGELRVGARSHHREPAGTIRVDGTARSLMRAVSALGSALKTTSPERSFPTLRGHPPEIAVDSTVDGVALPDGVAPPESDVRIEVPASRRYVYPAASLAYYLGATVEPGSDPRLVAGDHEFPLGGPEGYDRTVERTLKRTFFLDCVVRTEGYYPVDLVERSAFEETLATERFAGVDFDFAGLYEASLPERLAAYDEVPWAAVVDHVPAWKLTTHLAPTADNAELLPFLVDDLAVVRLPEGRSTSTADAQAEAMTRRLGGEESFTRSAATRSARSGGGGDDPPLIDPAETEAIEHIWADDHAPLGATKASVAAFRNRLEHTPSAEIGVTVVCNDDEMVEEGDIAASVYGDGSDVPLDVRAYTDLSTDALQAVLETERDFLHYIGHIDADGFECSDGRLDASELDEVGIDAFLLNACTSYEQGMELLEAGAVGGVVTLSDVLNSGATRVGKSMVRLLNAGFPLYGALDVAKEESFVGGQYIVVGDGNVDLVQHDGIPTLFEVSQVGQETYNLTFVNYPSRRADMGAIASNGLLGERYYLPTRQDLSINVQASKMIEYLNDIPHSVPVREGTDLQWDEDYFQSMGRS